jgi:hypothetical protein
MRVKQGVLLVAFGSTQGADEPHRDHRIIDVCEQRQAPESRAHLAARLGFKLQTPAL